MDVFFGQ
jgi:hypothetical protein